MPYNPQSKKLDLKIISGYFVSYAIGSRGSRFYYQTHSTRVIESDRAVYFEDEFGSSHGPREIVLREGRIIIPIPIASASDHDPTIEQIPVEAHDEPQDQAQDENLDTKNDEPVVRRSQRTGGFAILDDYIIYLQECEFDVSSNLESVTFQEAMKSPQSGLWIDAMNNELSSMSQNEVWELVELPKDYKPIRCKRVYKIKRDSNGQVEMYKARFVAKGYSQREGIDFK